MGTKEYYLGLDIGTNSVGYAVTDANYEIQKLNGKAMWGSRLFDEAQTAESRRTFRTNRRRLARRRWRIELLQDLLAEEISKVDEGFYQRLNESAKFAEDKSVCQQNSLFCDKGYCDADYHREYPTIYHLRKALMTEDKKFDIRLYYLAIHNILKHRGHFLFADSVENATSFHTAYEKLVECLEDEFGIALQCSSEEELSEVIRDKKIGKKDKNSHLLELFDCDKQNKQLKAVIAAMCGMTVKLAELFQDESLKEIEKASVSFSEASYEETRMNLEEVLQERAGVLDIIKGIYDWGILADVLDGGEYQGNVYLSMAKVRCYEKHQKDLAILKQFVREKDGKSYKEFFCTAKEDNYCAYVGYTEKNGKWVKVKKCSYDTMKKSIEKLVNKLADGENQETAGYIREELDNGTFLPMQVSKDNGVIPYQVHEMELKKILEHAAKDYEIFNQTDEDGISVKEKILQLLTFRIPYYVGPLNTYNNQNAWMIRKESGAITPWNFEKKVDVDGSAEKFIRRMTNKCTYLLGKDVLPKNSLLYTEFMVRNELNNVKIDNSYLPIEIKEKVFSELFKQNKKITGKRLKDFLICEGAATKASDLTGIDQNFKSGLNSYLDMRNIFGDEIERASVQKMAEELILWITLYGEDKKMLKRVIRRTYDKQSISEEQLKKISKLKYQGWGRLSREFMTELEGVSTDTGEVFSIMKALRETNDNLMQLLSQRYTFLDAVREYNAAGISGNEKITYDNLMAELVASPKVKRAAWQSVLIAEEIKKIMGGEPKKIFIEMARGPEEKKPTTSRKNKFIELYKKIKDEDGRDWVKELAGKEESDFRSIKLYLYYTQMGRCMYSGEVIELSQLYDTDIYDRDHIYPQSKTKDDSLDNLVLVKKNINSNKGAALLSQDIRSKMSGFWKMLRDKELISEEKYKRLMRTNPLTEEELAHFINRQLVETRQSSKVVAELFQRIYESEVVYVKAKAVSDFRQNTLKAVKVRSLNDYHHAHDAYLNIVVGNVYHEKFTNNPLRWLRNHPDAEYSLNRMFDFNIEKNGCIVWKRGNEGTITTVRKWLKSRNIQYTRYATTNKSGQNGGLFDTQIVSPKNNPAIPVKQGVDMAKYGGYKSRTAECFALVESKDKKGKIQRSIEAVPLYLKEQIEKEPEVFLRYCEEDYGLLSPRVIIPCIKKDAYLIINGYGMHLRTSTGKQLSLQNAVQLMLDKDSEQYLKKIEKFALRRTQDSKCMVNEYDEITMVENLELYDTLLRKHKDTIYAKRPADQIKTMEEGREKFENLSIEDQCMVLTQILHLFQCKPITADLRNIGGGPTAGKIQVNKNISKIQSVKLVNQSVTGLFQQEIDLLTV